MKRTSDLEEFGRGLAEALFARPWLCAGTLLASMLPFRDIRWCVGAAFLAGLSLSRQTGPARRGAVVLVLLGSAASAWADEFGKEWLYDSWKTFALLRLTFALVAAAWGMRSRVLGALAAVAFVAFHFATTPDVRNDHDGADTAWIAGGAFGALAVGALARAGRARVALVLAAIAQFVLVALRVRQAASYPGGLRADESVAIVLVGAAECALWSCAAAAGLAVRWARATGGSADTARAFAPLQWHPWTTAAAISALSLLAAAVASPAPHRAAAFEALMVPSLGTAFACALVGRSRAYLARAAPFLVGLPLLAVLSSLALARARAADLELLAFHGTALVWPLLVLPVLDATDLGVLRSRPVRTAALASTAIVHGLLSVPFHAPREFQCAWLALAPVAFVLATETRDPTPRVVLASLGLGVVSLAAFGTIGLDLFGTSHVPDFEMSTPSFVWRAAKSAPVILGTWLLGGLLVILARRARSLTAIPDDHPVRADFGERSPA